MKRLIFATIALAAFATSCTKSEMIEAPDFGGQPITFDTYLGKVPMTKAQSVDLAYLQGTNRGFHVNAFMHEQNTLPLDANILKPYMDKNVWWEGSTDTNIPNETATTKVIFATQSGDTAPEKPSVASTATYGDFECPTGWEDFPTSESTHYVICTFTEPGEGVNMGVWAVGNVTEITKFSNEKGSWEYSGVTYWPDANSNKYLAFVAYGVNTKSGDDWTSVATESEDRKTLNFTVKDKVEEQQDLIIAPYQSGKILNANSSNTTVTLNFKHVLSRIGFKLVSNQDNDVEIIVKSVKMKGKFAKTGTVDLFSTDPAITYTTDPAADVEYELFPATTGNPYGFATDATTTPTAIFANATYAVSTATNKPSADYVTATPITDTETVKVAAFRDNRYMMLIPSKTAGTYEIIVEYQLDDSAPETAKVSLTNWSFLKGKAYEFVLKVSTSKVGFYVEVSESEPGEGMSESYILTPDASANN